MRLLLPALALVAFGSAAHAQDFIPVSVPDTTVYAEPETVNGTAVTIPIVIDADVTSLMNASADIALTFDPDVLVLTGHTLGDLVPSGCANFGSSSTGRVSVTIACGSSRPFVGGPGVLVTFEGTLVGAGTSPLTISRALFDDGNEASVTNGSALVVTDPDPELAPIGTQEVEEDGSLTVELSVSDIDTPLDSLSLSATASDPSLVAASGFATGPCSGEGAGDDCRLLTITPAPDASGTTTVTVTVSDGDGRSEDTSQSFSLTVTAVNDAPTVAAPIADQETTAGFEPLTLDLSPVFADVDDASLTYAARSSDPTVASVSVEGSALTVTPLTPGDVAVTVSATDAATLTAEDAFELSVLVNVADEPGLSPTTFAVLGNRPNPASAGTRVLLDLPDPAHVRVEVFDAAGRRVRLSADADLSAGAGHAISLDTVSLPAGVYLYRVTASLPGGTETASGQMTVVR